jgi:hypothetical protein
LDCCWHNLSKGIDDANDIYLDDRQFIGYVPHAQHISADRGPGSSVIDRCTGCGCTYYGRPADRRHGATAKTNCAKKSASAKAHG